jgi:hypothetical protein
MHDLLAVMQLSVATVGAAAMPEVQVQRTAKRTRDLNVCIVGRPKEDG